MKSLIKILIRYADSFFGPVNVFLASAGDITGSPAAGFAVRLSPAAPVSMPDGSHGRQFISVLPNLQFGSHEYKHL